MLIYSSRRWTIIPHRTGTVHQRRRNNSRLALPCVSSLSEPADALTVGAPLLHYRFKAARSIERNLGEMRVALILNSSQTFRSFLLALITTISANSGGCKNRANDPNAALAGYTDAMGPFCRDKRAGAAFFWLALGMLYLS